MPELRKDPIFHRWVIIATERGVRPNDYTATRPDLQARACPFCPGHEVHTPAEIAALRPEGSVPNTPGWDVRVVPNKFPALRVEGELHPHPEGMYDAMNGVGAHEVIIETPEHDLQLAHTSAEHIARVLEVVQSRVRDLSGDGRLKSALVFKNHGAVAGATLHHSHSQLVALPMIPSEQKLRLEGAKKYYEFKERCVFCDMIHQELSTREESRLVCDNPHSVSFAPYASRSPFETWILPKRHVSAFEHTSETVIYDVARTLKETLMRLDKALDSPPYNLAIHSAPLRSEDLPYHHWSIEILPKLTRLGGFELASGFAMNPTPPEEAARFLRSLEL